MKHLRPNRREDGNHSSFSAGTIALIGLMAASLEAGKFALMSIPNVEVVTLLTALFGYVFGLAGIIAVIIFDLIEVMLWGFGTWVISYLIYWPLLCAVFWLIGRRKIRSRIVLGAVAVGMTVFFGVLSSLIDIGLLSGSYQNFWQRFVIYYGRGVWFYVAQIATNLILFPVAFLPMEKILQRLKQHRL